MRDEMRLSIEPVGGVYGMFTEDEAPVIRVGVRIEKQRPQATRVGVRLAATDMFGKQIAPAKDAVMTLPAAARATEQTIALGLGRGFFRIAGEARLGGAKVGSSVEIGVIPRFHAGIRKESFFASNTSQLRRGDELRLLQMIGMKVQRTHFQPCVDAGSPEWVKRPATGKALPLRFGPQDEALEDAKKHDGWCLPLVGYTFEGARAFAKTELAYKTRMHGPPRDYLEFVNTWETILRRYPELTTYEFWNEPWIFGWTWAATPAEYRKLQKMWCRMALKVNPKYRIITGNSSMFTQDCMEHDPSCWKGLLKGTTNHPYSFSTGQPTHRAGDTRRTMDDGLLINRRMGLPFHYLTEGGTEYDREYPSNIQNACKLVQYHVQAALLGIYQANVQWEIGYGPAWTRGNAAYAVMTHFLEDRPVVADIWPEHELIWGAIFANARHVTTDVSKLPRAKELSVRWNVPVPKERARDRTKVAVIWSWTGESNAKQDKSGRLIIRNAAGLRAHDLSGREIPASRGALVVPFAEAPVYITTDSLSVIELRNRIANATIENVTPLNLYAMPLSRPADERQDLIVRMENQMNCAVEGTVRVRVRGMKSTISSAFSIAAGKLADIPVEWPGVRPSKHNQYELDMSVTGRVRSRKLNATTKKQLVQAAVFAMETVRVDGRLDDWKGVIPVVVDSGLLGKDIDLTKYLLNPLLERPGQESATARTVARIYTAYDDRNVYIAAAVNEARFGNRAGADAVRDGVKLPFKAGVHDGLDHFAYCGSVFFFAFGFRDRVPGHGRQMDDPYRWKGFFRDTDYHYVAHPSVQGDMLVRQWGPDTSRRNAYQCEKVPGVGPVPGAKVKIRRDEKKKLTVYEIAIPRKELGMFDPADGQCRFSFLLYPATGGSQSEMNWGQLAGVFDHWRTPGSFSPSWSYQLPCQTYFGIER